MGYCRAAHFTLTVKGETKLSSLIIDAESLRQKCSHNTQKSAEEVLHSVMKFDKSDIDAEEHFFKVELIDIVDTNNILLDVEKVREYLSFVAPVTYSPNFRCQTEIYKYAASLNFKITPTYSNIF